MSIRNKLKRISKRRLIKWHLLPIKAYKNKLYFIYHLILWVILRNLQYSIKLKSTTDSSRDPFPKPDVEGIFISSSNRYSFPSLQSSSESDIWLNSLYSYWFYLRSILVAFVFLIGYNTIFINKCIEICFKIHNISNLMRKIIIFWKYWFY